MNLREARSGRSWPLGRKLGLTAWVYIISILINVAVSTACLLLYFKPVFREAHALFEQQQQLESLRTTVHHLGFSDQDAAPGEPPILEHSEAEWSPLLVILALDGSPLSQSLGAQWEEIRGEAERFVASNQADSAPYRLDALEALLTSAVGTLGARRDESVARAAEAQWWIIRVLLLNSFLGAVLCGAALWFVRRWVVRPVRVLREATVLIRGGDFDPQISLPFPDEMGKLGYEIREMARQIGRLQSQLVDEERQAAASEMVGHLEEYVQGPLAEIQQLAGASSRRNASKMNLVECQDRITATVSRFEDWLNDLKTGLSYRIGEPQTADLSVIISEVLDAVRPTLERHGVQAVIELDPGLKEIAVDKLQFEQAVIALVTNAAQASAPGQRIRISSRSCAREPTWWEVEVSDEGCGIPSEMMDRIFLPFFTTKRDGNGIGLGLVKTIIHQHGGELQVRSSPGGGSSFIARLPARVPAPLASLRPAPHRP